VAPADSIVIIAKRSMSRKIAATEMIQSLAGRAMTFPIVTSGTLM
jgi:hypothetical protein